MSFLNVSWNKEGIWQLFCVKGETSEIYYFTFLSSSEELLELSSSEDDDRVRFRFFFLELLLSDFLLFLLFFFLSFLRFFLFLLSDGDLLRFRFSETSVFCECLLKVSLSSSQPRCRLILCIGSIKFLNLLSTSLIFRSASSLSSWLYLVGGLRYQTFSPDEIKKINAMANQEAMILNITIQKTWRCVNVPGASINVRGRGRERISKEVS